MKESEKAASFHFLFHFLAYLIAVPRRKAYSQGMRGSSALIHLTLTDVNNFHHLVDRRGLGECWRYLGNTMHGYGSFKAESGTIYQAHRVAYALEHNLPKLENSKSKSAFVRHSCADNLCCNPNHLYLGDVTNNSRKTRSQFAGAKIGEPLLRRRHRQLNDDEVRSIRLRISNGEKQIKIANEYGVTRRCIHDVVVRKTFNSLT